MARSIKDSIKNTLSFNKLKKEQQLSTSPTPPTPIVENNKEDFSLELEESRYLLALIAKNDFKGTDIQIVYNIALKLQSIIKENLTEDNG